MNQETMLHEAVRNPPPHVPSLWTRSAPVRRNSEPSSNVVLHKGVFPMYNGRYAA